MVIRRLPLFVLAGGRSVRFGADKARAELLGRPLLRQVVDPLAPLASSITVVAQRAEQYADLGLTTIADREPHLGPLGGVLTALARLSSDEPWALVLPCDLWGIERSWLDGLLDRAAEGTLAVAYRDRDRWQPLPALLHRDLLPLAERQIQRDERALFRLLDGCAHRALPLPSGWCRAIQVNKPADLQRAERVMLAGS